AGEAVAAVEQHVASAHVEQYTFGAEPRLVAGDAAFEDGDLGQRQVPQLGGHDLGALAAEGEGAGRQQAAAGDVDAHDVGREHAERALELHRRGFDEGAVEVGDVSGDERHAGLLVDNAAAVGERGDTGGDVDDLAPVAAHLEG